MSRITLKTARVLKALTRVPQTTSEVYAAVFGPPPRTGSGARKAKHDRRWIYITLRRAASIGHVRMAEERNGEHLTTFWWVEQCPSVVTVTIEGYDNRQPVRCTLPRGHFGCHEHANKDCVVLLIWMDGRTERIELLPAEMKAGPYTTDVLGRVA